MSGPRLETRVVREDEAFAANHRHNRALVDRLRSEGAAGALGGGRKGAGTARLARQAASARPG